MRLSIREPDTNMNKIRFSHNSNEYKTRNYYNSCYLSFIFSKTSLKTI